MKWSVSRHSLASERSGTVAIILKVLSFDTCYGLISSPGRNHIPWWCHEMETFPMLLASVRNSHRSASLRPTTSDIGKTFGPLPDRRTGNHMENPSFTGPPKLFIGPIFFYIRIPIEGLLTATFFTGQEDRHTKGFHWSSTVFTGRGPRTGGFPDVCNFGGGLGSFGWFFFNFMFMIWDSRHEDLQLFWRSFKHCYWPFVRGIHWSLVDSLHKDQWRWALIFSLMCTWTNCWTNSWKAG